MADTPAPSALDAMLYEVDKNSSVPVAHTFGSGESIPEWLAASMAQFSAAPRLAAIVRVLMEALEFYESGSRNAFRCNNEPLDPAKGTGPCCERVIDAGGIAQDALARAEAIAKGE